MAAIHGLENMGKRLFAVQQRDRTSAKRGIYGKYFH
jgi:hypothetical protein